MELSAHGASDVGLVRSHNEDSWLLSLEHHLFLLADGLGGHQAGEIASREAVDHFYEQFISHGTVQLTAAEEVIRHCIQSTNSYVFTLSQSHELLKGMGTTLCALSFHDDQCVIAHIGDSRVYRVRQSIIEQMTVDHSWTREQMSLEGSRKGFLTKALGTMAYVEPSLTMLPIEQGDLFLLCSDGLTDMVPLEHMTNILLEPITLGERVRLLISTAKAYGGGDNTTVILVEVGVV